MILPFHFDFALRRPRHRYICFVEHIFNENSVARGGVVYEDVGDSAYEFAVLDDGATRQVCGQQRTTKFVIFFMASAALCISSFVGNLSGSVFTISNALYFDPA